MNRNSKRSRSKSRWRTPWKVLALGLSVGVVTYFAFGGDCSALIPAGTAIEMFGLLVALMGLNELPTLFERPTAFQTLLHQLKIAIRMEPKTGNEVAYDNTASMELQGMKYQVCAEKRYNSTEEAIKDLQQQIWKVEKDMIDLDGEVKSVRRDIRRDLREQAEKVRHELQQVRSLAQYATVAGVSTELMALTLVLFGLFLSSSLWQPFLCSPMVMPLSFTI